LQNFADFISAKLQNLQNFAKICKKMIKKSGNLQKLQIAAVLYPKKFSDEQVLE
jgi:hypothetical protein